MPPNAQEFVKMFSHIGKIKPYLYLREPGITNQIYEQSLGADEADPTTSNIRITNKSVKHSHLENVLSCS